MKKNAAKNVKEDLCIGTLHPKVNKSLKKSLAPLLDKYLQFLAVKGIDGDVISPQRQRMSARAVKPRQ